jgi:aryl-alcohol dehydrogenase-like predicted oxidoreductase
MQYRTLGRTGIKVSPYALGATTATDSTAPRPENTQAMGRFRWWWQVLCPASGH